jgi:hypothetical protein
MRVKRACLAAGGISTYCQSSLGVQFGQGPKRSDNESWAFDERPAPGPGDQVLKTARAERSPRLSVGSEDRRCRRRFDWPPIIGKLLGQPNPTGFGPQGPNRPKQYFFWLWNRRPGGEFRLTMDIPFDRIQTLAPPEAAEQLGSGGQIRLNPHADQSPDDADRPRLTIFQQDWWLQIAKGSAPLKEVKVLGPTGGVVGSLKYIVQRNAVGISFGGDPLLSRVNGPFVSDNLSDADKTIVLAQLIERLPNISFMFSISEHAPNADLIKEAFNYAGFECVEQLNYSQPPENTSTRLGKSLREHLKQAGNKLDVIDIISSQFINFYQANLQAYGNRSYFSLEIARELINASMKRQPPQARIIAACRKGAGRSGGSPVIDAAICIVWDNERCYYWLSTRRRESHPDAIKLLIVTAIKHAERQGLIFDSDGINTPGAKRLFRTIFRMPNEEKRYIFTKHSGIHKIYEAHRTAIDKVKKAATAMRLR